MFADFWGIRLAADYDDIKYINEQISYAQQNQAGEQKSIGVGTGERKFAVATAPSGMRANSGHVACEKCGRWYTTRSIMLRHMNHECGMEKKVPCPLCAKRFRRKWNLEQHIKRVHNRSRSRHSC